MHVEPRGSTADLEVTSQCVRRSILSYITAHKQHPFIIIITFKPD